MNTLKREVKTILKNAKQLEKLPVLSEIEKEQLGANLRFEATYFSNQLEGNKLDKREARNAIFLK